MEGAFPLVRGHVLPGRVSFGSDDLMAEGSSIVWIDLLTSKLGRKQMILKTAALLLVLPLSLSAGGIASAEEPVKHNHSEHMEKCYAACVECQKLCLMCADSCLDEIAEGKKDHIHCLKMCRDCALICGVMAQVVAQDGPLVSTLAEACAKACEKCAEECKKHADEEIHQKCAEQCLKCAEICREMAKG